MRVKNVVPFSKFRRVSYALSIGVLVAFWVATIFQGGFNLGIDFKPGLSQTVQISASSVTIEKVRAALGSSDHNFTVQPIGDAAAKTFQLRAVANADETQVANLQEVMSAKARSALEGTFGAGSVTVLQTEFIGPSLSDELVFQTFWLAVASVLVILLYIWFRFKFAYAIAAILSLIIDPIFIVGMVGTMQMEVTTATIAVVLTIIGYSMNDKIVVFDRIRENIRLKPSMNLYDLVDLSITETLSRTIVSSLTTILSMVAVYIFTQGAIKDFAFALIVGVVVATYSSIFIAAPLMVFFAKGKAPVEKEKEPRPTNEVEA